MLRISCGADRHARSARMRFASLASPEMLRISGEKTGAGAPAARVPNAVIERCAAPPIGCGQRGKAALRAKGSSSNNASARRG